MGKGGEATLSGERSTSGLLGAGEEILLESTSDFGVAIVLTTDTIFFSGPLVMSIIGKESADEALRARTFGDPTDDIEGGDFSARTDCSDPLDFVVGLLVILSDSKPKIKNNEYELISSLALFMFAFLPFLDRTSL